MNQVIRLVRWDVVMQMRNGFWIAGLIAMTPWLGILWPLSQSNSNFLYPYMIFLDISVTGTMFMAGIYFFEKRQGSLMALAVSPIRTWQWLLSKMLSLASIGVAMCCALVAAKKGIHAPWPQIIVACLVINMQFVLLGFLLAAPFQGFTSYLVANSLFFGIVNLPALSMFKITTPLYWLLPSQPALLALQTAFSGGSIGKLALYLGIQLAWTGLMFWLCLWSFHKFVSPRQGG
jgi:fluoroquinolone transport system permease protein